MGVLYCLWSWEYSRITDQLNSQHPVYFEYMYFILLISVEVETETKWDIKNMQMKLRDLRLIREWNELIDRFR